MKNALATPSINGLTDQEAVRRLAAEGYIRERQRKRIADLYATNPRYVAHRTDQLECRG
ncbi:hypothetical protein [Nitrosospira sp. Nsp14]|uniref:hypothetical protein n=1 Tax=Nitrosospira sp. Nsp14 TaxID=1855333 RepID=UPI0015A5E859|nr:hypothetical protein [Nitrosospira sp. Nsp14]